MWLCLRISGDDSDPDISARRPMPLDAATAAHRTARPRRARSSQSARPTSPRGGGPTLLSRKKEVRKKFPESLILW